MLDLKELKRADKTDKYSVWGFIRQAVKQFEILNIPFIIYYICLKYFWIYECFVAVSSKNTNILDDGATIVYNCDWVNSHRRRNRLSMCKATIDCSILQEVEWRFKIMTSSSDFIYINGINFCISCATGFDQMEDWNAPSYHWGSGSMYSCGTNYMGSSKNPVDFWDNNIYIITLNTKERTIKVEVQDETDHHEPTIIFYNIHTDTIKYKLFVSLRDKNEGVRLLKFSRKYYA